MMDTFLKTKICFRFYVRRGIKQRYLGPKSNGDQTGAVILCASKWNG